MTTQAIQVYANAAFEFAQAQDALEAWQTFLIKAAEVFSQDEVKSLLRLGQVTERQLVDDLADLCGDLDQSMQHFLWLLSDKRRLLLLSDIAKAFAGLCQEANQSVTAEISSAIPLSDDQQASLQQALSVKTGKQVTLECDIDEAMLGGVMIKIGDKVIDRSVLGTLMRLKQHMLG
jgi:F-type H+-transporting ATPase subunit delta